MKIYRLSANLNNYQTLLPLGEGTYALYKRFNGEALSWSNEAWPVQVGEKERPSSDFPGLTSHIPVFRRRSVNALSEQLAGSGEMVPLNCLNCEDEYVAMNVTRLVNALDVERSQVKRYKSSGRIMRIIRYAFLPERVKDAAIFKIPETRLQEVYVTNAVVETAARRGLQGFVFELIWTDDAFVILCPYCLGIIEEETAECPTCGLDTGKDAPLEMSLAEGHAMKQRQCAYCGTRIREWADPCPYCKRGEQRRGLREGIVIV